MKISAQTDEKFAFVSNCGNYKRVIVRVADIVHIGCFEGTKSEAEEAIRREYSGEAEADYLEKLDLLFKSKLSDFEDIHAADNFALRWAVTNGHLEVAKYLIQKGANIHADDDFVLRHASENGLIELVKFLVEAGANIHTANDNALFLSAAYGHLDVVQYLVEKGANIHTDTLRWAAAEGHRKVFEYLSEKMK